MDIDIDQVAVLARLELSAEERLLRAIPDLIATDPLLWSRRQLDYNVVKAKVLINASNHRDEIQHLFVDLIISAENMSIVLHKTPNPHNALQSS